MTEESQGIEVLPFHAVVTSFPHIAVLCQKAVKAFDHMIIDSDDIGVVGHQRVPPLIIVGIGGMLDVIGRVHVPDDALFESAVRKALQIIGFLKQGSVIDIHLGGELP